MKAAGELLVSVPVDAQAYILERNIAKL